MATVRLDGMLSRYVPRTGLSSSAESVGALLDELEDRYPPLRHRIRDETHQIRPFVKVFVNGEEIPSDGAIEHPVRRTDSVEILHSIQGG